MPHRLLVVALALCALVAPLTAAAQTTIDLVVNDIDAFWAEQFANAGLTYTSPTLRSIDAPMTTSCGDIDPYYSPGAYCAADLTVYYSTAWAPNDPAGEILWWTVLSHEWGHHIQWQVDTGRYHRAGRRTASRLLRGRVHEPRRGCRSRQPRGGIDGAEPDPECRRCLVLPA